MGRGNDRGKVGILRGKGISIKIPGFPTVDTEQIMIKVTNSSFIMGI